MKIQAIKENVVAIVVAGVLTLVAVFIINNSNFFRADIMLNNQKASTTQQWDISYSVLDWKLSVSSNKDISNLSALSLIVMFDKDKVKISKENIDSNFDFTTAEAGEWAMNVSFQNVSKLSAGDTIFDLKYDGDQKSVNIADVFVTFSNWEGESLAITKK